MAGGGSGKREKGRLHFIRDQYITSAFYQRFANEIPCVQIRMAAAEWSRHSPHL